MGDLGIMQEHGGGGFRHSSGQGLAEADKASRQVYSSLALRHQLFPPPPRQTLMFTRHPLYSKHKHSFLQCWEQAPPMLPSPPPPHVCPQGQRKACPFLPQRQAAAPSFPMCLGQEKGDHQHSFPWGSRPRPRPRGTGSPLELGEDRPAPPSFASGLTGGPSSQLDTPTAFVQ